MRKHKEIEVQSLEIAEAVDRLYSKYGKHALPEEEARKVIDHAMGGRSLTAALDAMRNG